MTETTDAELLARLRGFDRRLVEEYGIHAPVLDEAIAALAVVPSVPDDQLDAAQVVAAAEALAEVERLAEHWYECPSPPDAYCEPCHAWLPAKRRLAEAMQPLAAALREVSDETRTEGDDA